MRYIVSLIWTAILSQLVTYVVSSMTSVAYDYKAGLILGVALWAVVIFIPMILPDGPTEES